MNSRYRMLDGLSLVMISYGVYTYLVIDYMDPLALETVNRCVIRCTGIT